MNHLGHQFEHTTGALKVIQGGPIFIQAVKHLGVNRVGAHQAVEIPALLRLAREVVAVGGVVIRKGPAHRFRRQFVGDSAEQATTDDLKRLLGAHRFPQRLNAAEVVR